MFMNRMNKMGICCFLIVYFSLNDIILLVPFCAIKKFIDEKIKKIPFLQLQKESYKMEVIYPGIINLAEIINKILHSAPHVAKTGINKSSNQPDLFHYSSYYISIKSIFQVSFVKALKRLEKFCIYVCKCSTNIDIFLPMEG